MKEQTCKVIQAWSVSNIGMIAELESHFRGLAYGSILKSLTSGYSWTIHQRVIPGFIVDEVTRFENETESWHTFVLARLKQGKPQSSNCCRKTKIVFFSTN